MKRSNRLVLLIGVFLAALAFVFVIVLLGGGSAGADPDASAPPPDVATVIAAKDIGLGVAITADMLTTKKFAPDVRLPGAYGDPSQVIGSIARASIKIGQQVTPQAFAEQSGANLEVPAGFIGMAVQVDQVSGVGTLIKTGDYVDIVASLNPNFPVLLPSVGPCAGVPAPRLDDTCYDHTTVKVLIQGVQVVSTILPPPPAPAAAEAGAETPAPATGATVLNGQQEIVILAVTQQQAEVIRFAQLDGTITLMLRSPKDFVDADGNPAIPDTVITTGIILKTMVDDWGVLPPQVIYTVQPSPAP